MLNLRSSTLSYKKAWLVVIPVFIFAAVISVNFFKPFGFFRESNAAMICINADFWNHNALLKTHHIPIESYTFDISATPATQMWATVTSFGYGWFIVPYYFLTFLHLYPGEISIRIFSLLWLFLTLYTAWLLCKMITKNYANAKAVNYLTLIFYVFNASVLWYHIQGYVHEVAVLPFYFLSWFLFLKFVESNNNRWLAGLGICLFIAVQFDWLPCLQAAVISVYFFIKRNKNQYGWSFAIPAISVALGIAWIVYTYAQWATLPVYIGFLKEKFISRTVGSGGLQIVHGLNYNFNLVLFYLTGYGLLTVIFVWYLISKKVPLVIALMIITAVLHHIIFWGFSTEHDHGIIKMAFPIAFIAAYLVAGFPLYRQAAVACCIIAVNVFIYFFLHNFYTRKGMYTNPSFCYDAGKLIKDKMSAANQHVFINTHGKYLLQIEFYAGKSYILAATKAEAQQLLQARYPGSTGYFIDGDKGIISHVEVIR